VPTNVLLVRWAGGWHERGVPGVDRDAYWPRRVEGLLGLGAVRSVEEAKRVADEQLDIFAHERIQVKADVEPPQFPLDVAHTPYQRFRVGDRVRLDLGAPPSSRLWLPHSYGNRADTPHHADLNPVGDVEAVLTVGEGFDWGFYDVMGFASHWAETGPVRGWSWWGSPVLALDVSVDGSTYYTVGMTDPVPLGTRRVRWRRSVSTGEVTFAASATASGSGWGTLPAKVSYGTQRGGPIYPGTAPLTVGTARAEGSSPLLGPILAFELRDGFDGPVVAAPDFTTHPLGTTTFLDRTGKRWTLRSGARIEVDPVEETEERLVAMTVTTDPEGWPMYAATWRDVLYEGQAAYSQWLQKMANGTLGGQSKAATPVTPSEATVKGSGSDIPPLPPAAQARPS
jgi:hypothetical protein